MTHTPNVILVHGAWVDGSSWSRVIPELLTRGLGVTAVQLSLTSLADDVATVRRALATTRGPTTLVGHSYGGAVISEAGMDSHVEKLVFIAAFAPDVGESTDSLLASVPPTKLSAHLRPDACGFLTIAKEGLVEIFAKDFPIWEKEILFAKQSPTSAKCLKRPVSNAAWKGKKSGYVVATSDKVIPPELQHFMAERINAETIEINSGHLAMLSRPEKIAEFIFKMAK